MPENKRILVFGFKPYHNYGSNITESIIKKFQESSSLKKERFDVKFDANIFIKAIKEHKPDIVIGLGQCATGNKIRIERKAVNRKKEDFNSKSLPIKQNSPKTLSLSLKIPKDKDSWISYYAWDYVCNFAMYVIASYIKGKNIKFGFIHIPYNYDEKKATLKIRELIKQLN